MSKTHKFCCMSHPFTRVCVWQKLFDRLLPQNMAHKYSILFPNTNTMQISMNNFKQFSNNFPYKTPKKFFLSLSNTHTLSTYLYSENFSSTHASSLICITYTIYFGILSMLLQRVTYGSLLTRIFNHI